MLCRVVLARTDVSEENVAILIRVRWISDLGIALAITSNCQFSSSQLLVATNVPSLVILVSLMMEMIYSSETSVVTRATRHNIKKTACFTSCLLHKVILNYKTVHTCNSWRTFAVSGHIKQLEILKCMFCLPTNKVCVLAACSGIRPCWLKGQKRGCVGISRKISGTILFKIWGFHGVDYEECRLMGC
jgi:hypothetical protein